VKQTTRMMEEKKKNNSKLSDRDHHPSHWNQNRTARNGFQLTPCPVYAWGRNLLGLGGSSGSGGWWGWGMLAFSSLLSWV